jgi:hypothetical protein
MMDAKPTIQHVMPRHPHSFSYRRHLDICLRQLLTSDLVGEPVPGLASVGLIIKCQHRMLAPHAMLVSQAIPRRRVPTFFAVVSFFWSFFFSCRIVARFTGSIGSVPSDR